VGDVIKKYQRTGQHPRLPSRQDACRCHQKNVWQSPC
jgi:hypothetical protein